MRSLALAFALSVALNAGAVAWVATREPDPVLVAPHPVAPPPDPEPAAHDQIVPPATPDEPVAVTFLDDEQLRQLEAAARRPEAAAPSMAPDVAPAPARGHRDAPAIATTSSTQSETAAPAGKPGEPGSTGTGSSLMKMRGPEISQGPSEEFLGTFLANSKPLEKEPEPSGELAPSGNGTMVANQGTFKMHVARDGSVTFEDAPNLHVGLQVPTPKKLGKGLAKWAEDPQAGSEEGSKVQRRGDYKAMSDDDKASSSNVVGVPVVGGGFDATDALMRAHGQDPYFAKKLKVLDATRDERAQMRSKYDREQLAHASQIMAAHLARVWGSSLDIAAKKQALFELWEECAETGSSDLVEAGTRARAQVIGFIRKNLPAGSADAFTSDEVARLDAHRRSTAHFAPYP